VKPLEIKIIDEKGNEASIGYKGEIIIRGENVMVGYWKNEKATNETIKNGWLYTGDLGYMDKDGFLYVMGRFKSLLIANDGEKYSPEGIEETMVEYSKFIDQIMLHNNQSPYTIALISPNREALKRYVATTSNSWGSPEAASMAIQKLQDEINRFKKGGEFEEMFPERWLPTTFAVLPEPFSEQNHMINSTMKIVRGKIEKHYIKTIDHLYTQEGKNPINKKNIESLL